MDKQEFERLVTEALASVPEWFLEKLENIEVFIEEEPSRETLARMDIGRGGTLLGLYEGVPLDRRGFYYGNVLPDRIVLYRGPILGMGGGPEEIAARVREVVIHEIGHYFGLSDEELKRLEDEKGQ
jgi:predicted Zn-dependent protease with MMP-like domain